MNKRLYFILLIIGIMLIVIGILLPGEQIVRAMIPQKGEAYFGALLAGMRCLRAAIIFNGLLAVMFLPLKRYLWDVGSLPLPLLSPFFRQTNARKIVGSERLILAGILLLALLLRLIGSSQSLFGDEILLQQMYINRGLPVIFTYFAYAPQHVMYSVLAWLSEQLPLPIELTIRLPAILFGVGAVVLTYLLARQIFDRLTATVTGILSAAAIYGIVNSQFAKGYSATHCLTLLAVLAIIRIVADWQAASGWWLLGVSLGALAYVHLYNAYLCVGLTICTALVLLWCGGGVAAMKRLMFVLLIIAGALFLLYSIQLPQILDQMARAASQPEEHLSLNVLHGWLAQLTFWGEYWPVSLFCLGIAGAGVIALFKREPLYTCVVLGIPLMVLALVALRNSWIYPRYLLFSLPFFLIFCIEGARLVGRTFGVIAFAFVFLWPTSQVLAHFYSAGHQNVRAAAQLAAGKPTYSYGLGRELFSYYNPHVKPISTLAELKSINGEFYLVYCWRKTWRHREDEFRYIDRHFTVIERFDGMSMELFEPDGEVVLMRSNQ